MRQHPCLFDRPAEIAEMKYTHLTRKERYQIYALKKAGHPQSEIAIMLERSAATISRELSRSTGGRGYRPNQAHRLAAARACRTSCAAHRPSALKQHGSRAIRVSAARSAV
ncbi:MAG: hypothetical protein EPO42_03440 [Gallionellaceae bacterium]|nr:MAG: hypothetical protein EPO42_03440 [Gallionellaceae bacterium]